MESLEHLPSRSLEQGQAELGLQGLNLAAQWRLCDSEPRRGTPEVALLGDGHEVAQEAKVHRQSRYPNGIGRAQQVLDAGVGAEVGWKGNRHQTRIRSPNPDRSGEARSICHGRL